MEGCWFFFIDNCFNQLARMVSFGGLQNGSDMFIAKENSILLILKHFLKNFPCLLQIIDFQIDFTQSVIQLSVIRILLYCSFQLPYHRFIYSRDEMHFDRVCFVEARKSLVERLEVFGWAEFEGPIHKGKGLLFQKLLQDMLRVPYQARCGLFTGRLRP